MSREKITEKTIFLEEDGKEFLVEYYITEDEIHTDGRFGMCMYGLEVVKRNGAKAESGYVAALSFDKREVEKFINVLARNNVTPISVLDIVYDWVYEREEKSLAERVLAITNGVR